MTQNWECEELFLNELVRVELVPASKAELLVPFNVGEVTATAGLKEEDDPDKPGKKRIVSRVGTAVMVIDATATDATGRLVSPPTLKTTEKPDRSGYIRQHDLQIPTEGGYEDIRKKRGELAGVDFNVVLEMRSGSRFLLYALPNSSTVAVEDQFSGEGKQTVKVSLQSMSNMIKLTDSTT